MLWLKFRKKLRRKWVILERERVTVAVRRENSLLCSYCVIMVSRYHDIGEPIAPIMLPKKFYKNYEPLLWSRRTLIFQNIFPSFYPKTVNHLLNKRQSIFFNLWICTSIILFWSTINPFQDHFIDPKYLKDQFNAWFMNSKDSNN